jgi:hypothetical protein
VPKLYLVIDGLNECEPTERKLVLEGLTKPVGDCNASRPEKLRVLVVSQYYSDTQKGLQSSGSEKLAPAIIQICATNNHNDIGVYVKIWMDKIGAKNDSDESPFDENMREYFRNLTLINAKGITLGRLSSMA